MRWIELMVPRALGTRNDMRVSIITSVAFVAVRFCVTSEGMNDGRGPRQREVLCANSHGRAALNGRRIHVAPFHVKVAAATVPRRTLPTARAPNLNA